MGHEVVTKEPKRSKTSTEATATPDTPLLMLPANAPLNLAPQHLLHMQRLIGNRAVQRLLAEQGQIRREAAPADTQAQNWEALMAEDVQRLLVLRETLRPALLSDTKTGAQLMAGAEVLQIFQKWQSLDAQYGMNRRLLLKFVSRVVSKTLMLSKLLGLAEEMTSLLDELKRHLDPATRQQLLTLLAPLGLGDAPPDLVEFSDTLLETTLEFLANSPYFALGLVKGAYQSVEDLVVGLGEMIYKAIMYQIQPWTVIEDALALWETIKALDLGVLGQAFLGRWSDPNPRKRAEFQGFVIGYIEIEILVMILTGGAGAEAKAGAKAAGQFGKLPQLIQGSAAATRLMQKARPVLKTLVKTGKTGMDLAGGGLGALGAAIEDEQADQGGEYEEAEVDEGFVLDVNEVDIELAAEDSSADVQRLIQRAPRPTVKRGKAGEKQIMDMLLGGDIPGMPKMKHVLDANYNRVNGVDILAVEMRGNQRVLHVVEIKGGFQSDLKGTLHHGFQMSNEWVEKVMKKALKNPDVAKDIIAATKMTDPQKILDKVLKSRRWVLASKNRSVTGLKRSIRRIKKNAPTLIQVPRRRKP